jgi:hypothetical protein
MSLRAYRTSGGIMSFPPETEKLEACAGKLYENETIILLLEDSMWDDAKRAQLAETLAFVWNDA